jgi:PAS domain S-box-containing protein
LALSSSIVETSKDAIINLNLDGIILSWNPAAELIFGYSAEEMIGQKGSLIVPPEQEEERPVIREMLANNQGLNQYETVRISKSGRLIPVSLTISPIYDVDDNVIGGTATIRDITEKKEASQYARSLIEASLDPLVVISPEGKVTDVNEASEKMAGVSREFLIGTDFADYFTDPEKARAGFERALTEEVLTDYPLSIRSLDGKLTELLCNASVYRDTRGHILGVAAAARDVTGQKKALEQVRMLAGIIEYSSDAVISTDLEGIITTWNFGAECTFGYSAHEMIGQSRRRLLPAGTEDDKDEILSRLREGQDVKPYESERIGKDGRAISLSVSISPSYDETGTLTGITRIAQDITERKMAADHARALAVIVESSFDAIFSFDLNATVTSWNSAAEIMFGYTAAEIIGRELLPILPAEIVLEAKIEDERAYLIGKIKNNDKISDYETVRVRKNGQIFPVVLTLSPLHNSSGAIIGGSSIVRDITEQKIATEQMIMVATIIESSTDAIMSADLDGNYLTWNRAAERMHGYSAKEMIGQSALLVMPVEKKKDLEYILDTIRGGNAIEQYETVRLRKDGSKFPVSLTVSPIYDAAGTVVGLTGITRDITERKKAAQQINMLATIVESSDDGIWSTTLEGRINSWNASAERTFGYLAEEIIGQSVSLLFPPEKLPEIALIASKIKSGGKLSGYETIRMSKDGRAIPVALTISPLRDADGVIEGSSVIARDITEQKRTADYQRRLATIVESTLDAIVTLTLDGIITSWNHGAERMFGYSAEEMIGRTRDFLVPPGVKDLFGEALKKIRSGEEVAPYETERISKDGQTVTTYTSISPIRDDTGATIGVIGIARDISELKKSSQYQQRLATIVESSDDAIWSTDQEGIFRSWNSAAERTFGYLAEEIIGQSVSLLVSPEGANELLSITLKIQAGETLSGFGTSRMSKEGRAIPVSLTISPIRDDQGAITGRSVVARDITEQNEKARQLAEANSLRNEFVAMVAHDIRGPAASISGFAHLLLDQWDTTADEKKIDHLKVIARNTEHLATFIEDVLQVARIEAGEFTFNIREFNIHGLVERALPEIAGPAAIQKFSLIAPDEIPLVFGDEDRQWQVLINLLSNAVKFSPDGEPITVTLSVHEDSVEVAVTDGGIGIAKEEQAKLFQKFTRVAQPGGKKIPGNGLGLYICKILVETQGGKIWCKSAPGQGSTFAYTIPKSRTSTPALAPYRILILEDDLDIRYLIKAALSVDPRLETCWEWASAEEALSIAQDLSPELVILDHQLEGEIKGLQAAPLIKSAFPDARIILFTSQDLASEVRNEPAVNLFLHKSNLGKLLASVQQVMGLEPLTSK